MANGVEREFPPVTRELVREAITRIQLSATHEPRIDNSTFVQSPPDSVGLADREIRQGGPLTLNLQAFASIYSRAGLAGQSSEFRPAP